MNGEMGVLFCSVIGCMCRTHKKRKGERKGKERVEGRNGECTEVFQNKRRETTGENKSRQASKPESLKKVGGWFKKGQYTDRQRG